MPQWVFLNGRFVQTAEATLSFRDLAIQRGYGIFDFFRIHAGCPVFLDDHLDRFFRSARQMHLPIVFTREQLSIAIHELIRKNTIQHSGIRITLTGGNSTDGYSLAEPNLVMAIQAFQPCSPDQFSKGIRLMTVDHQRQLPAVKTIDYLMAIHLQPALKNAGADDVLYHNKGQVRECPRANFFLLTKDGVLVTPGKDVLHGITRSKVLQLASSLCKVEERELDLVELRTAREAFITSSTKQVLPVRQIDDLQLPAANPVAEQLNAALSSLIDQHRPAMAT